MSHDSHACLKVRTIIQNINHTRYKTPETINILNSWKGKAAQKWMSSHRCRWGKLLIQGNSLKIQGRKSFKITHGCLFLTYSEILSLWKQREKDFRHRQNNVSILYTAYQSKKFKSPECFASPLHNFKFSSWCSPIPHDQVFTIFCISYTWMYVYASLVKVHIWNLNFIKTSALKLILPQYYFC